MKKITFILLALLLTGCSCMTVAPAHAPIPAHAPVPTGDLSFKEALHLAGGEANLRTLDSLVRIKN
ncbi:MAG: hypothetical protein LBU42_10055 [Prevotellaceae bacterium]|nr:hypothetical protein [Prevotellaceae bacterium]